MLKELDIRNDVKSSKVSYVYISTILRVKIQPKSKDFVKLMQTFLDL